MTDIFSVDKETSSKVDLTTRGADAYSRDISTRVLMMAYHLVGSPEQPRLWLEGDPVPPEWIRHVNNGGLIAAWNGNFFDRLHYDRIMVHQHGFPPISGDRWQDSMHKAAHANMPRSLDACSSALKMNYTASLKDKAIIRRITNANITPIPCSMSDLLHRRVPVDPKLYDDMVWLANRCVQDVVLEEGVLVRLPEWPTIEPWVHMPFLDMKINDRGILVDMLLVAGLKQAGKTERRRLDLDMNKTSKGRVPACTNTERLKLLLVERGVELPRNIESIAEDDEDDELETTERSRKSEWRLRKSDIADLLARPDLPEDCRLMLMMRMEAAKASVSKLDTIERIVSPDGRLRNWASLMGAQANGRFSSGKAQLHNFIRDAYGNPDEVAEKYGLNSKTDKVEIARLTEEVLYQAIEHGRTGDADLLRRHYEMPRKDMQGRVTIQGVLPWISRMMRRVLSAPRGMMLLNGDFANIEARIPVWLAGQEDVVDAFRRGEDVYRLAASPVYGIAPEHLSKEQRQIGKVMTLFLGFMGGVNAFIPAAMNYGVNIAREDGQLYVDTYRKTNNKLVEFADANLQAAVWAATYPGQEFIVPPKGLLSWKCVDNCLKLRLPSGRVLRYWEPRLEQGYWPDGNPKRTLDLMVMVVKGPNRFHRPLWRGLAIQNPVSAIAADMLCHGLVNMDKAGLPVVLHVHDNIASQEREERVAEMLPVFEQCMLDQPSWTTGLPVAVSCDYSARFG
jgi:DNA polymerase bacteriophage-type